MKRRSERNTSWQKVAPWYNRITGDKGHYYHQHVVIPGVLRLLNLKQGDRLLDLACGNGVLAKAIAPSATAQKVKYLGVDLSDALIKSAKSTDRNLMHQYVVADVTGDIPTKDSFTHASIVLALQNIKSPDRVTKNVSKNMVNGGKLVIVLNHPAFRIPRQSAWGFDEGRKIQFRRVDKYISPMTIPINVNPGDPNSEVVMSYHFSLTDYSKILKDAGFVIELIEEWTSDKESRGKAAKMENRARAEIPLFMAIVAIKRN